MQVVEVVAATNKAHLTSPLQQVCTSVLQTTGWNEGETALPKCPNFMLNGRRSS